MTQKLYPDHDPSKLEPHYCAHISAMTSENLHAKSDIAIQLAWRDKRIAELEGERDKARSMAMQCAKTRSEYQQERDDARAKLLCDCGREKWSRCSVCDNDE